MDFKQTLNDFQTAHPGITTDLPVKLPTDLTAITKPGGLISEATTAYCVTQFPELYYASAAGGAVGGVVLALVLCFVSRKLFGRKAKPVTPTPPPAA